MSSIGFVELLVIFVLGLLILGPERLPRVVSKLGRWIGKARRTASDLRRQLEREIELEEFSSSNRTPPHRPSRPTPFPPPADAEKPGAGHAGSTQGADTTATPESDTGAGVNTSEGSAPSGGSIWPPEDAPPTRQPAPGSGIDPADTATTRSNDAQTADAATDGGSVDTDNTSPHADITASGR